MAIAGHVTERAARQDVVAMATQRNLMRSYKSDPDATLLAIRGILAQADPDIGPGLASDAGTLPVAEAINLIDRTVDRRSFKLEDEIDLMKHETPPEQMQLVTAFERFFGLYHRTDRPPFTDRVYVPAFDYRIAAAVDQAVEVDVTFLTSESRSAEAKLTLRDVGFVRSSAHSASVTQNFSERRGSFQLTVPVDLEFFEYAGPMQNDLRYTAQVKAVGEIYFARPEEYKRYTHVEPLEPPVSLFPFMELKGEKTNHREDVIERSEGFQATASCPISDSVTLALDYKTSMQQEVKATYRKRQEGELYISTWPPESRFKGMTWITNQAPGA